MQWEITIIVSGKHLSDLLEAIESQSVIEWSMKPIKGAVETRGRKKKRLLKEIEPAGGSMADKVGTLVREAGVTEITREELSKLITKIGGNPSGLSYYIANLRHAKIIGKYDSANETYAVRAPK